MNRSGDIVPLSFYLTICSLVFMSPCLSSRSPSSPSPSPSLSLSHSLSFSPVGLEQGGRKCRAAMEALIAVHHHVLASAQCLADRGRHRRQGRGPARVVVDGDVERLDCNQNAYI